MDIGAIIFLLISLLLVSFVIFLGSFSFLRSSAFVSCLNDDGVSRDDDDDQVGTSCTLAFCTGSKWYAKFLD